MTEELNTHIEKRYSECRKRSQGLSYGSFYDGYVDCYCEAKEIIKSLCACLEDFDKDTISFYKQFIDEAKSFLKE